MPIWKHVVLNLVALASLLLMPYILIAAALALAYGLGFLRQQRERRPGPARKGRRDGEVPASMRHPWAA